MLHARDGKNCVKYRISTLIRRFLTKRWGRYLPDDIGPPGERTLRRWMRRLVDAGLVAKTGRRTRNGMVVRQVRGEQGKSMSTVAIPAESAAILDDLSDYAPYHRRERAGVRVPCPREMWMRMTSKIRDQFPLPAGFGEGHFGGQPARNPSVAGCVAGRVAGRTSRTSVVNTRHHQPQPPNSPSGKGPVAYVAVVELKPQATLTADAAISDSDFCPGKQDTPEATRSGESILVGDQGDIITRAHDAAERGGLMRPESLPDDPHDDVPPYRGPRRPRVTDRTPEKARIELFLRAYSAAVHFHTGEVIGVRGLISGKLRSTLLAAARRFENYTQTPHMYAVALMAWMREKSPNKVPPIHVVFARGMIGKMVPMIEDILATPAADAWRSAPCEPDSVRAVWEWWEREEVEVLDVVMSGEGTQAAVDAMAVERFGQPYQDALRAAHFDLVALRSADIYAYDQGEWVWRR